MDSQCEEKPIQQEPTTDVVEEIKVQEVVADDIENATPEIQPSEQGTSTGAVSKTNKQKQKGKRLPNEAPEKTKLTVIPEISLYDDFDTFKINLATFPEVYEEMLTDTIQPKIVSLPTEAHFNTKKYITDLSRGSTSTSQFRRPTRVKPSTSESIIKRRDISCSEENFKQEDQCFPVPHLRDCKIWKSWRYNQMWQAIHQPYPSGAFINWVSIDPELDFNNTQCECYVFFQELQQPITVKNKYGLMPSEVYSIKDVRTVYPYNSTACALYLSNREYIDSDGQYILSSFPKQVHETKFAARQNQTGTPLRDNSINDEQTFDVEDENLIHPDACDLRNSVVKVDDSTGLIIQDEVITYAKSSGTRGTPPRDLENAPLVLDEDDNLNVPSSISSEPSKYSGTAKKSPSSIPKNFKCNIHLGDFSITPQCVVEYDIGSLEPKDIGQNILQVCYSKLRARTEMLTLSQHATVIISSWIVMPICQKDLRQHRYTTEFKNIIGLDPRALPLQIVFGNSVPSEIMSMSANNEYALAGESNYRAIASVLIGARRFARGVAEGIASSFKLGHVIYNTQSLWTILYIMERKLWCARVLGAQPIEGNPVDHITYLDVSSLITGNINTVEAIIAAIDKNTIFIEYARLSPSDINVLRHLSAGLDSITFGHDVDVIPISHLFTSPAIEFVLWADKAIPAQPVRYVPTATQVRDFGIRLAIILKAHDFYVQGFVRANTLLNGLIVREPSPGAADQVVQRYITSGLEIGEISIPLPMGYNFMWDVMGVRPKYIVNAFFAEEWDTITKLSIRDRIYVGALATALYSMGVSAFLHNFNLTGRELLVWASPTDNMTNLSFTFTNELFYRLEGHIITGINAMAVNTVSQVTDMALNYKCFLSDAFCNARSGLQNLTHLSAWQGAWGLNIPYIVRPESLQYLLKAWLSIWAISAPGASFDFKAEMHTSSDLNTRGLYFAKGESKYLSSWANSRNMDYIPYGQLAINMLRQHFRFESEWTITYHAITPSTARTTYEDTTAIEDDRYQPIYENQVYQTIPGSIITYDWERNCKLAPILLRRNTEDHEWRQILSSLSVTNSEWAGYVLESPLMETTIPTLATSFRGLFKTSSTAADPPKMGTEPEVVIAETTETEITTTVTLAEKPTESSIPAVN